MRPSPRPGRPAPSRSATPASPGPPTYATLADAGSTAPIASLLVRAGPQHAPGPAASAAGAAALGLHRRRAAARPGRPHRVRMRHRAAGVLRHRAAHRMHDGPGDGGGAGRPGVASRLPAGHGRRRADALGRTTICVEADPALRRRTSAIRQLLVDHCILGPDTDPPRGIGRDRDDQRQHRAGHPDHDRARLHRRRRVRSCPARGRPALPRPALCRPVRSAPRHGPGGAAGLYVPRQPCRRRSSTG